MPVGTAGDGQGHVSGRRCARRGADIVLGNTYHLMLRPGRGADRAAGRPARVHALAGPILTDSGGFQVMSLSKLRKLTEKGVTFRSHIDGAKHELTPERSIEIQGLLGSDIPMQLDECVRAAGRARGRSSARCGCRCAGPSAASAPSATSRGNALFGIVQGGDGADLRGARARRR